MSPSCRSLSFLAPSPPRCIRDEATVFSRVDLQIWTSMGLLDAASSGGLNAGLFIALRALSLPLS
eukprot:scaffold306531_cov35-Attheya_sp.AAC.1